MTDQNRRLFGIKRVKRIWHAAFDTRRCPSVAAGLLSNPAAFPGFCVWLRRFRRLSAAPVSLASILAAQFRSRPDRSCSRISPLFDRRSFVPALPLAPVSGPRKPLQASGGRPPSAGYWKALFSLEAETLDRRCFQKSAASHADGLRSLTGTAGVDRVVLGVDKNHAQIKIVNSAGAGHGLGRRSETSTAISLANLSFSPNRISAAGLPVWQGNDSDSEAVSRFMVGLLCRRKSLAVSMPSLPFEYPKNHVKIVALQQRTAV